MAKIERNSNAADSASFEIPDFGNHFLCHKINANKTMIHIELKKKNSYFFLSLKSHLNWWHLQMIEYAIVFAQIRLRINCSFIAFLFTTISKIRMLLIAVTCILFGCTKFHACNTILHWMQWIIWWKLLYTLS